MEAGPELIELLSGGRSGRGGIDFSKLTDEELDRLNAELTKFDAGRNDGRSLEAGPSEVVAETHQDARRSLEGERDGTVPEVPTFFLKRSKNP